MSFRVRVAVVLVYAAHTLHGVPVRAAQGPLTDAQRDYYTGHYNRVVDSLTGEAEKSPNDAQLYFLLGQSYYQLREFARSVKSLEHSVQLAQGQSEYHDWLGKAYGRRAEETVLLSALGWARKAHTEFEIAVQLNSSNFEAQRDLIRYEIHAPGIVGGGDDRALKHIEVLEKIDPLQGQLARGEFLSSKKRIAEADAIFAKIFESNTTRIGVYFELAEYYGDRQNPAKMSDAIAAAKQIDASDRSLKFYDAVLLVVNGKNPTEAESLLKSYLATVPDNSDLPSHSSARESLGNLYGAQGRFSEAAEEYRISLTLDPHNEAVQDALKRVQKK